MSVLITNKAAIQVLSEWAAEKGEILAFQNGEVSVRGFSDEVVRSVLDSATTVEIERSNSLSLLTQVMGTSRTPVELEAKVLWLSNIITQTIDLHRAEATENISNSKLLGLVDKTYIAEKVIASTASDGEIATLQAEVDLRALSETPAQLAEKIILKAGNLRLKRSKLDGLEDKSLRSLDGIDDVTSFNTVFDEFKLSLISVLT